MEGDWVLENYSVLQKYQDFSERDKRQLEIMFDLAEKKKKAFSWPVGWIKKMLATGLVVAIRGESGRLLSFMLLLPVPGSQSKHASLQAALWRSPEAACINWQKLTAIAGDTYEKVFFAVYKDNRIANALIYSQPGVTRISEKAVSLETKKYLLSDSGGQYLYEWSSYWDFAKSKKHFETALVLSA